LNDGQVLELGRSQMEERLQRFVTAYSRTLSQMPNRPYRVDLRYANGFAVRATGLPLRSPGAG
jgi:cell division protein FtsQ